MIGLWSGEAIGHILAEVFVDYPLVFLNITEQKGQVFAGQKEYPRMGGVNYTETFSGFISKDGEIFESDSTGGITMDKLTSHDSMELKYVEEGADQKVLMISLTRQKS